MVTTVMKRRVGLLEDKILDIVLQKDEDTATDNANKDSNVFSTQRDLIAGAAAKHIAEHHFVPKHLMKAHKEGLIHCHDLDYFPLMGYTNCCLVDLRDMLENGFSMNGVKIETPKGIQTAMTLASQIVMAVGSQQYGGISFNRLDEVLENYVTMSYMKWLRIAEDLVLPHLLSKGSSISIGYIGLNEMVNAMFGESTHIFEDQLKKDFALEVLSYIDNYVNNLKEKSGIGYSVYATTSERQCYRLCKCVEDKFGVVEGVPDKGYFTNSFHLEATKQTDPYPRMTFEAEFIPYSSGGFISYGEFPDMTKNLEALENVWDFSYEVTPYYAVNVPSDKCLECKFEGELNNTSKGFVCPKCNNSDQTKLYAIRRVSGYLGSPAQRPLNVGKSKEVKSRVKNL